MTRTSLLSILALALVAPSCVNNADSTPVQGSESRGEQTSTGTDASYGLSSHSENMGDTGSASSGDHSLQTSTSGGASSTDGAVMGSSGDASLEPIALETSWLDAMAGPWLGPVPTTPYGPLPQFFMEFAWEEDGSLHTFVDNEDNGSFDFRFVEQDGQWVFIESGTLPGGATQTYTLHPIAQEGSRVRFVYLPMPAFLAVEIDLAEGLAMDVAVLGSEHAAFDLQRPGAH